MFFMPAASCLAYTVLYPVSQATWEMGVNTGAKDAEIRL